ncbi:nucleophile aminohydrolase [Lipomyces oligophaga]|uniref:nucleophile aminohydrolase n=1 Tax=Lipomyces oligophaga TaxID=45792 RepID=UPI0034CE5AFC
MGGFSFENYQRNKFLTAKGYPVPKATATGTTIVGCRFEGGVVIAADTRATSGDIVADKNCEKLHRMSPTIWCAGAGTAADCEFVTQLISSTLELHSMSTGRKPRVVTCLTLLKQHLFKYQGHVGAYLIVAGVDPTGPKLFSIHAHGSTDVGYYLSLGSGSMAAMATLESKWHNKITKDEAMALCAEAIEAGIWNDLGSGSNVDMCVMEVDKPAVLYRNYRTPNERAIKENSYKFARGTTRYLSEKIKIATKPIAYDIFEETVVKDDNKMEVDS